ncbi:hypothetical protein EYF80_058528 [Liparis tanakae]|uniref:Uncharacterized protein n=1 Tax=Liparis tanakae TaxID=230148 RepID=A0A4Z2ER51_9TELE|nr:hypothetical protein EYF80_058528 [Liparis tanakae]
MSGLENEGVEFLCSSESNGFSRSTGPGCRTPNNLHFVIVVLFFSYTSVNRRASRRTRSIISSLRDYQRSTKRTVTNKSGAEISSRNIPSVELKRASHRRLL